MDTKSCYSGDYVWHPRTPRQRSCAASKPFEQHFLKHAGGLATKSAYAQHFTWPDAPPAQSAGSDYESVLSEASRGHRFNGATTYSEVYDAESHWKAPAPAK